MTAPIGAVLAALGARGGTVGYADLAAAVGITGTGRIARLAADLEALMGMDAAAGQPFRAALLTARTGGGLPAPGFFAQAAALGRPALPDPATFVAAERAALRHATPDHADTAWAVARYEGLRAHLPAATFPAVTFRGTSRHEANLADVADDYDAFLLDAFGVLNTGDSVVPGAPARIAALQAMGKRTLVLTNGASYPREVALAKYRRLGFTFAPDDVVASRDLAAAALAAHPARRWAAIAPPGSSFDDLPAEVSHFDPAAPDTAQGFLFLGQAGWTAEKETALIAALRAHPRPLICANPDIVSPWEGGFVIEPGHFAHRIAAATGITPRFLGKPYPEAFAAARARLPGIPAHRIAMVGDTLHTDILGGRAAGIATILITNHGLFRGTDPAAHIAASGIVPDVIARTT